MCAMLAGGTADAARVLAALRRRGLDLAAGRAVRLFGPGPPAGAEAAFTAAGAAEEARRRPARRAGPRFELRVQPATAEPYLVRAGEFIQVIDVRGRQCSDLVAYQRGGLERGVVRGIDNVTT